MQLIISEKPKASQKIAEALADSKVQKKSVSEEIAVRFPELKGNEFEDASNVN